MTLWKISFLPVVPESFPRLFNNSVLAISGDLPAGRVRQISRILTHAASQSGGGGGCVASCCLFLQQDGPHLFYFNLYRRPASVAFIT